MVNLINRPIPWVAHVGDRRRCPVRRLRWSEEPVCKGRCGRRPQHGELRRLETEPVCRGVGVEDFNTAICADLRPGRSAGALGRTISTWRSAPTWDRARRTESQTQPRGRLEPALVFVVCACSNRRRVVASCQLWLSWVFYFMPHLCFVSSYWMFKWRGPE